MKWDDKMIMKRAGKMYALVPTVGCTECDLNRPGCAPDGWCPGSTTLGKFLASSKASWEEIK